MSKMKVPDEYIARAMLLGMRCSKRSWAFYVDPGIKQRVTEFFHPVTLEPLTRDEMRKRHQAIEVGEDPDKIEWEP